MSRRDWRESRTKQGGGGELAWSLDTGSHCRAAMRTHQGARIHPPTEQAPGNVRGPLSQQVGMHHLQGQGWPYPTFHQRQLPRGQLPTGDTPGCRDRPSGHPRLSGAHPHHLLCERPSCMATSSSPLELHPQATLKHQNQSLLRKSRTRALPYSLPPRKVSISRPARPPGHTLLPPCSP